MSDQIYNVGQKVIYQDKVLATVTEYLGKGVHGVPSYRIRLRDLASEQNPYYKGTVCSQIEIYAWEPEPVTEIQETRV